MHKGHYGEYSGNAKWSKVTDSNMGATKRDDKAHMDYLKQDVKYDNKHGHSDEKMTADEKHISKLAGDLKYDEKKQGSPAKHTDPEKFHIHNKSSYGEMSSEGKTLRRMSTTSTKSLSKENTSKLKNAFKVMTKK